MSYLPIIDAMGIPQEARVDKRVPKKMLMEQGAPTSADKRQIQDGIEELHWIAALKPTNVGVPVFRDDAREYLEIAVLTLALRANSKQTRLTELVHRAIPYPVVLVTAQGDTVGLSLAHKRWSQGETGKVVIEDVRRTPPLHPDAPTAGEASFFTSLAIAGLPKQDLFALYQGWLDRVAALEASQITGVFAPPDSAARSLALRNGLDERSRLQREIAGLRARAAKERQMNRRVELNLEIKRLETELAEAADSITIGDSQWRN